MRAAGLAFLIGCMLLFYQILVFQISESTERICVSSQYMTESTIVVNEMTCVEE